MEAQTAESTAPQIGALSIDQFCGRFAISRRLLYTLWDAGRGPAFIKVGSRRVIPFDAARAWQAEQLQRGSSRVVGV